MKLLKTSVAILAITAGAAFADSAESYSGATSGSEAFGSILGGTGSTGGGIFGISSNTSVAEQSSGATNRSWGFNRSRERSGGGDATLSRSRSGSISSQRNAGRGYNAGVGIGGGWGGFAGFGGESGAGGEGYAEGGAND